MLELRIFNDTLKGNAMQEETFYAVSSIAETLKIAFGMHEQVRMVFNRADSCLGVGQSGERHITVLHITPPPLLPYDLPKMGEGLGGGKESPWF